MIEPVSDISCVETVEKKLMSACLIQSPLADRNALTMGFPAQKPHAKSGTKTTGSTIILFYGWLAWSFHLTIVDHFQPQHV